MPEELSQYDLGAALARIDANLAHLVERHGGLDERMKAQEDFRTATEKRFSWISGLLAPLAVLWPLAVDYIKYKWGS